MPQTYCQLARDLGVSENSLTSAIQRAGIPCDSDFNGSFLWLTDDVLVYTKNRIMLHTNSFGEFPLVSLPALNMLEVTSVVKEIINSTGLDTIVKATINNVPSIALNPEADDLYHLAYFLACLWVDIKQETYKCRYVYWNPTVSFETPVYYRCGHVRSWTPACNILRANVYEIVDSIYKFLLWSHNNYAYQGAKYKPTIFPMTLSDKEDILKMPGVACLNTPGCKQVAFNMLTLIRSLTAQMCCMLLRRGNDAFVVKPTTEATLADDIKQFYLLIQKMEAFINNG